MCVLRVTAGTVKSHGNAKYSIVKPWSCREALEFYNKARNKKKLITVTVLPTTDPIFIYKVIIAE